MILQIGYAGELDFLKANKSIINSETRTLLSLADSTSKRLLGGEMSKKGLITAVGERRGRKYILNN